MKLKKNSFLEGAYIATACIFISKILGIIYVIPFYRIIGEQGGALYGYAYNIYNVFYTISSAGIPFAICKLTSEYGALGLEDKKIRMYRLSTILIYAFSLISFLVCFCFSQPIAQLIIGDIKGGNSMQDVVFVIRCISFTLLIVPLLSIKRGYLQGHKYISQPSISQVVEQLARIIIILVGSATVLYVTSSVRNAVGISVLAAGLGGLISFLYLSRVVRNNREELGLNRRVKSTRAEDKQILSEIVICALPFIVINLANTLYTSTDMILVLKTLPKLGFSAYETEFVSSVFTTWGTKFNAIITAVSTGLIVSLIPHMVSDYTAGKKEEVNANFNKTLKIILLIITPLSCFVSLMADSFWTVFYSPNKIGYSIIRVTIIITIFDCLYMVMNSLTQSLNKKRIVFVSVLAGLITNLILDIPLMHLFSYLGLSAYYGAIAATLCGFLLSNTLSLIYLHKNLSLHLEETLHSVPRALISLAAMIVAGLLLRMILPIESSSKLIQLFNISVSGIICAGVYLALNFRAILSVLPPKLLKKLHIKISA